MVPGSTGAPSAGAMHGKNDQIRKDIEHVWDIWQNGTNEQIEEDWFYVKKHRMQHDELNQNQTSTHTEESENENQQQIKLDQMRQSQHIPTAQSIDQFEQLSNFNAIKRASISKKVL